MSEQEITTKEFFSRQLKHYMDIKRMNTVDVAKLLNVTKQAVSSWCNGEKMPRMDKIEKLCLLFNVKKSDLLEEKTFEIKTSEDNEIIELFSKLPTEKKRLVIDLIKNLLDE